MGSARKRQVVIEHDPNQTPDTVKEVQGARSGAEEIPSRETPTPSPAVGAEGYDWDRVVSF